MQPRGSSVRLDRHPMDLVAEAAQVRIVATTAADQSTLIQADRAKWIEAWNQAIRDEPLREHYLRD